jgi:hypothetical protein
MPRAITIQLPQPYKAGWATNPPRSEPVLPALSPPKGAEPKGVSAVNSYPPIPGEGNRPATTVFL